MSYLPMEVRFGPVKQSHGTLTQQYFFAPLNPIQGECVLRFAHAKNATAANLHADNPNWEDHRPSRQ